MSLSLLLFLLLSGTDPDISINLLLPITVFAHRIVNAAHELGTFAGKPRVLSFGGSAGGLFKLSERIVQCVDVMVDRAQAPDSGRGRKTSLAEERAAVRGAGVRSGLMSVLRQADPFFNFRLAATMVVIWAMVEFKLFTRGFDTGFTGAQTVDISC